LYDNRVFLKKTHAKTAKKIWFFTISIFQSAAVPIVRLQPSVQGTLPYPPPFLFMDSFSFDLNASVREAIFSVSSAIEKTKSGG
jgi:hypothetical protein